MKRLIIICEGETEQEFCSMLLTPYLRSKRGYVLVQTPLIKRSRGGILPWKILKKEIENYLRETDVVVSSLLDFYGIGPSLHFPRWKEADRITDKNQRLDFLEGAMKEDIDERLQNKFIPYLQLHEFEGLLFNNIEVFETQFSPKELIGRRELIEVLEQYDNPEMINDGPNTHPSQRLERIIDGYAKVVYGNILAEAIGIEKIRSKSPRFNQWIEKIETACAS